MSENTLHLITAYVEQANALRARFFADNAELVDKTARTMAVALASILTAIGNDYGFDRVFAKQVQALAAPGDVVVGISTSGNSPNILAALRAARDKGCVAVGLAGRNGAIVPLCDYALLVPHDRTALIQEVHITIGHLLCKLVDHYLFEAVVELGPFLEDR